MFHGRTHQRWNAYLVAIVCSLTACSLSQVIAEEE